MTTVNETHKFRSKDINEVLIQSSVARQIAMHDPVLDYLADDQYIYETERLDSNPQLSFGEGRRRRADYNLEEVTVNVPRIDEGLNYSRRQLAKIARSNTSLDKRIMKVLQKFGEAEDRYFFAEDPIHTGLSVKNSSNHTDWGATAFNVTTAALARSTLAQGLGQLFDRYGSLLKSLFIGGVASPNVYKLIGGDSNENTDASAMTLLTNEMQSWGLETGFKSHIWSSKFLGMTLDFDGPDVVNGSDGADHFLLFAYDPNAYKVPISIFDVNPVNIGGDVKYELGESYLPIWMNVEGLILEEAVTVA